jgi:drug/metabolite transporter (DMT)-like permease
MPALRASRGALLVGSLAGAGDAFGKIACMLAKQTTRLDVATVLAALYPAATVLLASGVRKETVSARQWLGVALCLIAIVLITL